MFFGHVCVQYTVCLCCDAWLVHGGCSCACLSRLTLCRALAQQGFMCGVFSRVGLQLRHPFPQRHHCFLLYDCGVSICVQQSAYSICVQQVCLRAAVLLSNQQTSSVPYSGYCWQLQAAVQGCACPWCCDSAHGHVRIFTHKPCSSHPAMACCLVGSDCCRDARPEVVFQARDQHCHSPAFALAQCFSRSAFSREMMRED